MPRRQAAAFLRFVLLLSSPTVLLADYPIVSCRREYRRSSSESILSGLCQHQDILQSRNQTKSFCGRTETTRSKCWEEIKRQESQPCCTGVAGNTQSKRNVADALRIASGSRPLVGYMHVGIPDSASKHGSSSLKIYGEQMALLQTCGLAMASNFIFVGLSFSRRGVRSVDNATAAKLVDSLKQWAPKNVRFQRVDDVLDAGSRSYEAATLKVLHDDAVSGRVPSNAIIFYFHNKGGSGLNKGINVVLWRRYMEYHILENPQWCLRLLAKESNAACGVDWAGNHYSGNFWWATAGRIALRPPPDTSQEANYVSAEVWIGKGGRGQKSTRKQEDCKFFSLCDSKFSLYKNPIYRHLYAPQ